MPAIDLEALVLKHGSHDSAEDGMCVMEAASYIAGEPFTDHPACVSPIIGRFLRTWNDDLDDEGRQKLKPYLPRILNTAGDGHDEMRGWLCADWLVRVHTPAWLELGGITESAAALRALPPLRATADLTAAQPALNKARADSDAAWAAAWDAAWAAARDAASESAWAAAWAAARDAARAAARDAAWAAARAAARDAASESAWAAASDAAWAAARAAAVDPQKSAREAANAVLAPTKIELQASALELLEQLIDPTAVAA